MLSIIIWSYAIECVYATWKVVGDVESDSKIL